MKQEKSTLEWFKELPPLMSQMAVSECINERLSLRQPSLRSALSMGFIWKKTKLGFDFWFEVSRAISDNDNLDRFEEQLARMQETEELTGHNVALAKQLLAEMEGENE
jgi:hypothetical protein